MAHLDRLRTQEPLAGAVILQSGWLRYRQPTPAVVKDVVAAGPHNPLMWVLAGAANTVDYQPYLDQIARLARAYPNNYALACAENLSLDVKNDLKRRAATAERAVRCAPGNAQAWLMLDTLITFSAQSLREGRTTEKISDTEWERLRRLYALQVAVCRRAVALAPRSGYAWYALSGAATFAGEDETARGAFWKAYKLIPHAGLLYQWGLEMFQEKWGGTDAEMAKMVKLAVNARFATAAETRQISRVLKTCGYGDLADQVADRAIEQAKREVTQDPEDADAHYALAMSYHERNDHAHALPELREALRLQPARVDWRGELGEILLIERDYGAAIPEFQLLIQQIPDHNVGYSGLGRALAETGRYAEAEGPLREANRLRPHRGVTLHFLGEVLYQLGKKDEALKTLQESARLEPWIPSNYQRISILLAEKGQTEAAVAAARRGLELSPMAADYHWALGRALLQEGDAAGAVESANEAMRLNPAQPAFPRLLGDALLQLGKKEEAIAAWETVLKLDNSRNLPDAQAARQAIEKARQGH